MVFVKTPPMVTEKSAPTEAAREASENEAPASASRTLPPHGEILAALETLEALASDLRQLAHLDEPTRVRLATAAGALSRPDRYTRKALSKELTRQRVAQKRERDQAVLAETGIRALRREAVFRTPLPRATLTMPALALDAPLATLDDSGETGVGPDELTDAASGEAAWARAEARRADGVHVLTARICYVCKTNFREIHHFYDQMCPACAAFNWTKRNAVADLRGRVVLITGARVKIGYQASIFLLRAGAEVVVVTRFPNDAARRYAAESDAHDWRSRLHIYGCDLRHTPSVEALCQHWLATLPRLDGIINNACQTVRRPAGFYQHLLSGERAAVSHGLSALERGFVDRFASLAQHARRADAGHLVASVASDQAALAAGGDAMAAGVWRSAVLTQVPLLEEDLASGNHLYPAGQLDADLQQVDLRDFNTWRMTLADVPTAELLEVQLVNAIAPFVINARLKPLMAKVPTADTHIVNVSAMEGQFYRRWKTDKHPHTNMAKAALNMMTRTSAADYKRYGIHINSVDTGWVTDEDPVAVAARKTQVHGFHPPLDIVDGAARIVDPLFDGLNTGKHWWGMFLKDYKPAPW